MNLATGCHFPGLARQKNPKHGFGTVRQCSIDLLEFPDTAGAVQPSSVSVNQAKASKHDRRAGTPNSDRRMGLSVSGLKPLKVRDGARSAVSSRRGFDGPAETTYGESILVRRSLTPETARSFVSADRSAPFIDSSERCWALSRKFWQARTRLRPAMPLGIHATNCPDSLSNLLNIETDLGNLRHILLWLRLVADKVRDHQSPP